MEKSSSSLRMKKPLAQTSELKTIRKLFPFLRPHLLRFILGLAMAVPVGLLDAALVLLFQKYIDLSLPNNLDGGFIFDYVRYIPFIVIAFGLIQGGFSFGADYFTTWVISKVSINLRMALFKKLIATDAAVFDQNTSGMINLRYSGDAETATSGLIKGLKVFIQRALSISSLVVTLFVLSWEMAIIGVGIIGFGFLPLKKVRRKIKELVKQSVAVNAQLGTKYTESIHGNRTTAAYNLQEYQTARIKKGFDQVFTISIKMVQRSGLLKFFMRMATSLGLALTLWLAGYMIASGRITIGTISSFVSALLMLYTPLKSFGSTLTNMQTAMLAAERVTQVLEYEPEIQTKTDAKQLDGVRESIRYNNVGFAYAPDTPVLRNITFEARVGRSVAFVGNSGGGKSTIVNLLPRFYDVSAGTIEIDGTDIRDLDLKSLRDNISVVFQDNYMFTGTIRENIVLDQADASEEDIQAAVKAACLDEFVGSLKNGLETEIGERGVTLSGGQKQRVAIARAFLRNTPVVILDEATSALDNKSEVVVQQAIENLMRNKTVLIIAHRLTTVINADTIMVVMNGEIVESGSHQELIDKKDGTYASLYKTQFAIEETRQEDASHDA